MFLIVPVLIIYTVPPDLLREESRDTNRSLVSSFAQVLSSRFSHVLFPGYVTISTLWAWECCSVWRPRQPLPPSSSVRQPDLRPDPRLDTSNPPTPTFIHLFSSLWYDVVFGLVLCGCGVQKASIQVFQDGRNNSCNDQMMKMLVLVNLMQCWAESRVPSPSPPLARPSDSL